MSQTKIPEILQYPICFKPNRVWRLYKGGALLDQLSTGAAGQDGFFPEEWIASTTVAQNGVNQQSQYEGLSKIDDGCGGEIFFRELLEKYPFETIGEQTVDEGGLGILCKFIDSAIRLPIQCHPDVAFAKRHCGSNHGKTELWLVLGSRQVNGIEPYLYVGFKPDVDKEKFKSAVYAQDIKYMADSMHKFQVRSGDVYFIPGRLIHAIGPGVFVLEVQEPTDLVVQPEKYLDGVELSEEDMWKGLSPEIGLECFDYDSAVSREQTIEKYSLQEVQISNTDAFTYYDIVNSDTTGYFKVQKVTLFKDTVFKPNMKWYIGVVAEGKGLVKYNGRSFEVGRGSYFLAPAVIGEIEYRVESKMEIYLISK